MHLWCIIRFQHVDSVRLVVHFSTPWQIQRSHAFDNNGIIFAVWLSVLLTLMNIVHFVPFPSIIELGHCLSKYGILHSIRPSHHRFSSLAPSSKNASTHVLLTHSGRSNTSIKNWYSPSILSSKNSGESLWNGPVFGGSCLLCTVSFSVVTWILLERYRNWEYRRRHVCWVLPRNTSIL